MRPRRNASRPSAICTDSIRPNAAATTGSADSRTDVLTNIGIGILLTGTVVTDWSAWAAKHGFLATTDHYVPGL